MPIDAFTGSSPTLSADTAPAKATRPAGLPLKWRHVSRTIKDSGEAEEKTTAIVISRLERAEAHDVSFEVPAGYRLVDKL